MEHKNGLEDCYVIKNSKKLQCGYTTGSCAAAAAKAATSMLLLQKKLTEVDLMTPKGILLHLLPEDVSLEKEQAVCAVLVQGITLLNGWHLMKRLTMAAVISTKSD